MRETKYPLIVTSGWFEFGETNSQWLKLNDGVINFNIHHGRKWDYYFIEQKGRIKTPRVIKVLSGALPDFFAGLQNLCDRVHFSKKRGK